MQPIPEPEVILADPSCSSWLRAALQEAKGRDPVDAANDADLLASVLKARYASIIETANSN